MKLKILKSVQLSVIAASMLTSCLVLSNAYAKDVYLAYIHDGTYDNFHYMLSESWFDIPIDDTYINHLDDLQKSYGNIAYGEHKKWPGNHNEISYMILRGALDQPKWGAFTVGVIPKDKNGKDLPQQDLTFESQKKAFQFCKDLAGRYFDQTTGVIRPTGVSPFVVDALYRRVIMVPYTIDYDTGSQQASDGTSVPAKKYVMCPNYGDTDEWKLDPTRPSENEETGIVSGILNEDKTEYTVTCMPAVAVTKPPITLTRQFTANGVVTWSDGTHPGTFFVNEANLTNLHQFNKYLGAQYCPVSPE